MHNIVKGHGALNFLYESWQNKTDIPGLWNI